MNFNQISLLKKDELNRGLIWGFHRKQIFHRKNYMNDVWHYSYGSNQLSLITNTNFLATRCFRNNISILTFNGESWWCELVELDENGNNVGTIQSPEVKDVNRAMAHMLVWVTANRRYALKH